MPCWIWFRPKKISMLSIDTVGGSVLRLCLNFSPDSDSIGELFKNFDRRLPVDAGICDTDSLFQAGKTALSRDLLVAFVDMGLNHHADNPIFTLPKLVADRLCDLGLVLMVFL